MSDVLLHWDGVGEKMYEAGVSKGVLFVTTPAGAYGNGVAWTGLTAVNESPSGAEENKHYADNIKYLSLVAAETFKCTVGAYTYPDEFAVCDGTASPTDGVFLGQQNRKSFGLCYRTRLGNDVAGNDYGYKLHLIYGCKAAPSSRSYQTINDSPEAIEFSWEVNTTPETVTGYKAVSNIVIDSTKVDATKLNTLLDMLYGTANTDPYLPDPNTVISTLS